jgi:hypothetical protein
MRKQIHHPYELNKFNIPDEEKQSTIFRRNNKKQMM